MTFSKRTDWDLAENDLAEAVRARRNSGQPILDLTRSNPTTCGFAYSAELLRPLSDAASFRYHPVAQGQLSAREAVSRYYADHGATIDPDNIVLTTSTSEAYSFLFRLLCDPGDDVLVARPSYPLFDYIARLDDVALREYPLFYDPNADAAHGWSIDFHALQAAIGPRTRAIIVVHPSNPTGNFVSELERALLEQICRDRGLALLVDEVFLDYAIDASPAGDPEARTLICPEPQRSSFAGESACLTFVLSGLSKVCALPQMKISWIVAGGPGDLVRTALDRLDVIADTFLSVNTPMQLALPRWLEERHSIQAQIRMRLRENLAALRRYLEASRPASPLQCLSLQGGWTAVLRVPRTLRGQSFAAAALENGVLVQPGEFYGLPEGRAVLSLLTPPEQWLAGLQRLPAHLE